MQEAKVLSPTFFCEACLEVKPLSEKSSELNYCKGCYDFLHSEQTITETKDYLDGAVFIHYGEGYIAKPTGQTVCIGPYPPPKKLEEKLKPEKSVSAVAQKPPETPPNQSEHVAKLPMRPKPLRAKPSSTNVAKLKHPGGRPIKRGEVHRSTAWRRQQKEIQGSLL